MKLEHVLESAVGVAEGRYAPMYKRESYENAMLDIAKSEAQSGESTARAFVRLCEQRDPRMLSLYTAARQADEQPDLQKRQATADRMQEYAKAQRRPGETEQQAFVRLLKTDSTMRQLYESR